MKDIFAKVDEWNPVSPRIITTYTQTASKKLVMFPQGCRCF